MKNSVQGCLILLTLLPTIAQAKNLTRYGCSLISQTGNELESFMMLPQNEVHQYVSPERKFFIDLKKAVVKVHAPVTAPPAVQGPDREVSGVKLSISLYGDFTAHFGSGKGLIDSKSAEFDEEESEIKVSVSNSAAVPPESFQVRCEKLKDVNLPKILKKDKVI